MWFRPNNTNIEQELRRNRPEPREEFLQRTVARVGGRLGSSRKAWPDVMSSLAPIVVVGTAVVLVAVTSGLPSLHRGSPFGAANVAYSAPTCSLATQGNHPRITVSNINGNTSGTVTVTKSGGDSESGTVTGSGSATSPGSDKFDASHLTTPGTFSAHVILQGSGVPGNFYELDCGPTVLS
jgi:hypothetical protein